MINIIKASLLNVGGRIVSILATLVSVFFLGRMFSSSEFGYWTWLFSIFSLITAQDFGFIGAMRVRLGHAISEENFSEQKLLFCVAVFMSLVFGVILLGVGVVYVRNISLNGLDVLLVLSCSLVTVIGYCGAQGSVAYLQSGWVGIAEALRGIFQISVIVISRILELQFEVTLVLFYAVSALYTPFVMGVFLRSRQWGFRDLFYALSKNSRRSILIAAALIKDGSYLWLAQIGLAILSLSDVFIAGFLVSDNEVAVVNAIMRLILVAVGFVMAAMTPVTGHFVLKLAVIDQRFVWKRFSIAACALMLTGIVYGIFLYHFGPMIIATWANLTIERSYIFVVAGLLFSVMGMMILLQTFFQMRSLTKDMLPLLIIAATVKICLPYLIVPIAGYSGVFLSSFIVNATFVVVTAFLFFKRSYLKKILTSSHD